MQVTEPGHVSLFVRDLDAAVAFYRNLLGLRETGRGKGGRIACPPACITRAECVARGLAPFPPPSTEAPA